MADDPRLSIVRRLVEQLRLQEVAYCHWKSNEHLAAAVRGDTDLDILFEERARPAAQQALTDSGFVHFVAVWYRRYRDVEDYLGADPETGKLVHVHAHFRLVLGETGIKSFRLPWEEEVLSTREWDAAMGIYRSEPSRELLLLLVREALKLRPSRRISGRGATRDGSPTSGGVREMPWLRERASERELPRLAETLIGGGTVYAVQRLWNEGLSTRGLAELKAAASHFLRAHRRAGVVRSSLTRQALVLGPVLARAFRKLGIRDVPSRRVPIGGGAVIAVVGTDGSGKSTLAATLHERLGEKMDVLGLYMGSAENQAQGLRGWLLRAWRRLGGAARREGDSTARPETRWLVVRARGVGYLLWALLAALDKAHRLRRASRARGRGLVVVCDRYPQTAVEGFNDGPLLGHDSRYALVRWCARWERSRYALAARHAPDLVIKLVGSLEVLAARRPEMSRVEIGVKQEGIQALLFPCRTAVEEIDADQSAERVAALAMTAVLDRLRSIALSRPAQHAS